MPRPYLIHRLAAVTLILLVASGAAARDREPDYQQWVQLYTAVKLPRRLLVELDLQSRRLNAPLRTVQDPLAGARVEQNPNTTLMVRPLLGYRILPSLAGYVGYAWAPTFFDNPDARGRSNVSEHRVFEQLSLSHGFGALSLSARTRLEQRVRTNGPGSAENDAGYPHWAHRFRQLLRATYALGQSGILLIGWDELFVHLNRTNYPSRPGIDQNRAFVGLGYQAGPLLRAELGYMNLFVRRYSDAHQLNHVLSLSLNFGLDLSGGS